MKLNSFERISSIILIYLMLVCITSCKSGSELNASPSSTAKQSETHATTNTISFTRNDSLGFHLEIQETILSAPKAKVVLSGMSSTSSGTDLNSIAKGNSIYIICGNNGAILNSSDGVTWYQLTTNLSANLRDVIFDNETHLFYVVGDNGTILSSSNGETWIVYKSLKPSVNLNSITVAPGHLVIAGDSTTIFDIDLNYNSFVTVYNYPLESINMLSSAYGNGTVIIGGADGSIFYKVVESGWGVTYWYRATRIESNSINSLYYDDFKKIFLAVGSSGYLISSKEGVTWGTPQKVANSNLNSIAFNFVANEYSIVGGSTESSLIESSQDLVSWSINPTKFSAELNKIRCFESDSCYIVGTNNVIIASTNQPQLIHPSADMANNMPKMRNLP